MRKLIYTSLYGILLYSILCAAHAQNNPPVAVDDYDTTYSGVNKLILPKSNDTDPDGAPLTIDTLIYTTGNGKVELFSGIAVEYTPDSSFFGIDTVTYVVCDTGIPVLCDTALIIFTVIYKMYEAYEILNINNISARFNAAGSDFWDLYDFPHFEVPKGSGIHSMFVSNIWIGGLDSDDSLHIAAQIYYSGRDFWAGPIMDTMNYSFTQDSTWNRLWKINKCDIDSFISWFNDPASFPDYAIPNSILDWPAHGNISLGQSYYLAPFYDYDGDGFYNPFSGDYPIIKGDQAIYFIRNDDRDIHMETGGKKLGIEIHGMAYAFNCPADSALWNTIFLNYKIINRSYNNYHSTFAGIYADFDIGYAFDDYIGCDTVLNSFFGYNGDAIDEPGSGSSGYGSNPPAQSVTILNSELAKFSYFYSSLDHYNALNPDSDTIQFMFPGDPNDSTQLSEVSVGNTPDDRRGVGSIGPISFSMNDTINIDLAFVFARDYTGNNLTSVSLLKQRIQSIQDAYNNGITPCGDSSCSDFTNIPKSQKVLYNFILYPNPAKEYLVIDFQPKSKNAHYRVYDLTGRVVIKGSLKSNKINTIQTGSLNSGFYFISIFDGGNIYNNKFIKN
ncbi:MAG: Ig-like domain-containing protein [Bacteroidota bacterium]